MKSIDFKSLLIGILGTALIMVLMGQARFETGRFQSACTSTFCLFSDTETGIGNIVVRGGNTDLKVVYNP